MKRQQGKVRPTAVLLVAGLIVSFSLVAVRFLALPDYEDEKEHNDLKYLAQLESLTVDEYVAKESARVSKNRYQSNLRETIIDAIHLNQNDKLPDLVANLKSTFAEDYQLWPYLYSEAIKADNMPAFLWLLKQRVPCDYSVHSLGGMAFYTAVEVRKLDYFELLLKKGCDIKHVGRQDTLHDKIKRMRNAQWLELLYSYYPIISLP